MSGTAQATLAQGNTSFSTYVAFDGVEQGYIERQSRSVVTLDGVKHSTCIKKRTLRVTLRDMYHEDLTSLFSGVTRLASWTYLDADLGARTANFYLTGPTVRQKKARDGLTLCSGISFELEEK